MQIKKGSIIKEKSGVTGLVFSVDKESIVIKYSMSGNDYKNVGAVFRLILIEEILNGIKNGEMELIDEA